MNSFQYAIAKAAWEAYSDALHEHPVGSFESLEGRKARAWLAAAAAVIETASSIAQGTR